MSNEKTVNLYRFRDTDDSGWEEYDIAGDRYFELIDLCCKYCCTVSFVVCFSAIDESFFEKIKRFLIKSEYMEEGYETLYYSISPEVADALKNVSNSIFSWTFVAIGAEDLTFYREDKSIFLKSVTHDGICDIFPREEEDISNIISQGHWEKDPNPMTFDFTPKSAEWQEGYIKDPYRIKEEKYWEFLNRLNHKLSDQEKSDKDFLKSCESVLKIADNFGYSVDKVVKDFSNT